MHLRFLGTSAAMPSARRSNVSFVLWADRPVLIECGPTTPWQLARLGIDHREIAEVFISHVHGDHSLGLPMLLTLGQLDGRNWPLRVYCPASAVEPLRTVATACYPSLATSVLDRVEWIGLPERDGVEVELVGGLTVTTAPGQHSVPELAYRFERAGPALVYSGDTGPTDAVRDLARGAALLLHEATWSETIDGMKTRDHTSARQAGQLAAEAGVERLGLVHLHKNYLGREDELRAEAAAGFGGPILVPDDGDELKV
jgi:ribonuclease Z